MTIVSYMALTIGLLFALLGVAGALRFPDVYTRLQASSKCSTTALLIFYIGAIILADSPGMKARILVILLFTLATSPLSSHAIGRSAYECDVVPWRGKKEEQESGDDLK